jgi:NTP pyrophosphatase (non-canonical NTP hydrolase)
MAKKVQEFAGAQKQISGIQDMVLQLGNICNQACEELKEEFNRINSSNP